MDKDGIKTLMKEISRFDELDAKEIDLMAAYLEYRQEPDDSIIIKEGEIGDNIFYIVSGEAKVSVRLPLTCANHPHCLCLLLSFTNA